MTVVSRDAFEAFRTAKQQAYDAARPIATQGRLVEVENDSTRAGLEAAAPLLAAEAVDHLREELAAERLEARRAQARANEAARLSADARDEAEALNKVIADLRERVEIVEQDRMDLAAWAVNLATKHHADYRERGGIDPFKAIEEALADVALLRRLNDDSANTRDRAMDTLESAQSTMHGLVTAGVRNDEIHRRAALPLLEAAGFTADEARDVVYAAEEET